MPDQAPLFKTRYKRTQPEPKHGWNHTRSVTQRGYGYQWQKLRKAVLQRDNYLCVYHKEQGQLRQANQVDHKTPKSQGGTDELSNLQSLCYDCHKAKTARDNTRTQDSTRTLPNQ